MFELKILFKRADVIIDIQWATFIANNANKVLDLNVIYARVAVVTDIQ